MVGHRTDLGLTIDTVMGCLWDVFGVKLTVIHIVSIPTARYHHWFISTIGMKYHLSSLNQNFLYQGSEMDLLNPSHSWWQHNAWILMLIHHWSTRDTLPWNCGLKSRVQQGFVITLPNTSLCVCVWFLNIHKMSVADKSFYCTLCQKLNHMSWAA